MTKKDLSWKSGNDDKANISSSAQPSPVGEKPVAQGAAQDTQDTRPLDKVFSSLKQTFPSVLLQTSSFESRVLKLNSEVAFNICATNLV